jgi:hypothetical protein
VAETRLSTCLFFCFILKVNALRGLRLTQSATGTFGVTPGKLPGAPLWDAPLPRTPLRPQLWLCPLQPKRKSPRLQTSFPPAKRSWPCARKVISPGLELWSFNPGVCLLPGSINKNTSRPIELFTFFAECEKLNRPRGNCKTSKLRIWATCCCSILNCRFSLHHVNCHVALLVDLFLRRSGTLL